MTRLLIGLAALFAVASASGSALATVYTIRTTPYLSTNDHYDCSAGGSCANFTTAMSFGGALTFGALPANAAGADLYPYLTDFSLSDGLTTYQRADPAVRVVAMEGSTDANGVLTSIKQIWVQRYQDGLAGPHVDALYDEALFDDVGPAGYAAHHARCHGAWTVKEPDTCMLQSTQPDDVGQESAASFEAPTVVQSVVPTLGEWAMVALALLLAGAGAMAMGRRRAV